MSSALQNRLVGTIIIVAIAVIFLPNLLNGKKESKRDLFVDLPAKPNMRTVKLPAEFDVKKVQEAATRKVEVLSETAVDEVQYAQSSLLPSSGQDRQIVDEYSANLNTQDNQWPAQATVQPGSLQSQTIVTQDPDRLLESAGWVVQLGSFSQKKNVEDLLNRLDKAGYRAFSRPVKTQSGTLTKVFVGPDLQKNKLQKALAHLQELTQLQGRITPFTVQ